MAADAAPFELPGDERGILCIHGFTGTPYEMRPLADRLHQRGFTVHGMLLPAHGTSPEELNRSRWEDWYAGVETAFDALRRRCDTVCVVGQSLGGLLTLHLAKNRGASVTAIASLAAPVWLPRAARAVAGLAGLPGLADAIGTVPKIGGSDAADPVVRRDNPGYPVFPLRAVRELSEFMALVRRDLGLVRVPTIIVHGRQDHTAPVACAHEIARRVGAPRVRKRTLHRSFHLVACDVEHALAADHVATFFEEELARSGQQT